MMLRDSDCRPTNSLHRAPPRDVPDSATTFGCRLLAVRKRAGIGGGAGELEERRAADCLERRWLSEERG